MAGFGASTPAHLFAPGSDRAPSSRRSLPNGPCNYRDAAVGACGCDQFWDKCSIELHEASTEHRPSNERSTWCVCGHHACYHRREPQPPPAHDLPREVRSMEDELSPLEPTQIMHNTRPKMSQPSHSWRLIGQGASHANGPGLEDLRDTASHSTSGLPRVPSVCFLPHDRRPEAGHGAQSGVNQTRQSVGLGLSMLNIGNVGNTNDRPQSATSTVPDDEVNPLPRALQPEHASSATVFPVPSGKDSLINVQLDLSGDTIPNTYNLDDFIQSATEVATPSAADTPDLAVADQAAHETKKLVDTLVRLTNAEQQNASPGPSSRTASAPAPAPQLLLSNSPAAHQEQLQTALRDASPQALHKLISYLTPLHNLLNTLPNVAHAIREINARLDLLENNGSFNYVHPEDLHHHLESYDGRLMDLEHRIDEHERLHQQIDTDQSSSSAGRNHVAVINESFASNNSLQSTTSSTLILAAMDRKEMETEFGSIKDRLDVLEGVALPTSINPWEVEVVLLPWGRELQGIWFSSDEPMHDSSRTTTQDSEEWTQAQSSKMARIMRAGRSRTPQPLQRDSDSSPHPHALESLFSDSESGWSSQAISDWASGSADEWLSPKACGGNNLVYKRLLSRGFVRHVTLKSSSARDIQATLSHAFRELLEHLQYTEHDDDPTIRVYSGLRASFIPLRKVMRESRLRFLTPSEMSSSALWSAQFLASDILMRVSGGKKRLYVTQREAYMQHSDQMGSSWTWQEIRQLPRFQPHNDAQMEGNEEQCQPPVAEADAKEACWQYIEAIDAPPLSVNASFSSRHSIELSMRPADRDWRRSITPSSILKNRQLQPISPLSEHHPQRQLSGRNRTASSSAVEQILQGSTKRRHDTSPVKHSSAPQGHARTPSSSIVRLKRRRVTDSISLKEDTNYNGDADVAPVSAWNPTPRRSREPPSPFFSSQPELPRSNSDAASRPSQRSVAVVGKSTTPFAYATPHSGPFLGGPGFGGFKNGGDTEPDEDNYQDDGDDGEQSWHGVTTGTEGSGDDDSDAEAGAQGLASFSGDDSGFGTDEDDGDHSDEDVTARNRFTGSQRTNADDGTDLDGDDDENLDAHQLLILENTDDEDSEQILEKFLGVLQD